MHYGAGTWCDRENDGGEKELPKSKDTKWKRILRNPKNFVNINIYLGENADYIIDSAPFKHGKYAPASHLPIVPPEYFEAHPVDAIVITAPGYTDEIAGIIRKRFGDQVEIRAMRSNHLEMV